MKGVEDIYPLSPMQSMMLFHACSHGSDDSLFNQSCYEITGPLDLGCFGGAWQSVVEDAPSLRSSFFWEGIKQPQQIVRGRVKLVYDVLDWRGLSSDELARDFSNLCRADRERGFDLTTAPLMRIVLVSLADDRHLMIWSSHHLIMDRWCIAVVLENLGICYAAELSGAEARRESGKPYREYIAWIRQQDEERAREYWSSYFAGLAGTATLTEVDTENSTVESSPISLRLEKRRLELLKRSARTNRVTMPCLVQAAWALALSQVTDTNDVVFGVAVSGRPPGIGDVESIVGSFVNNLPVRVRLSSDMTVDALLQSIQVDIARRAPFEYVSLVDIQAWCGSAVPGNLFDSLIVWLAPAGLVRFAELEIRPLNSDTGTAYPLTLNVSEEPDFIEFTLQLSRGHRLRRSAVDLLSRLGLCLDALGSAEPDMLLETFAEFELGAAVEMADSRPSVRKVLNPEAIRKLENSFEPISGAREVIPLEDIREYLLSAWQQVLGLQECDSQLDFFQNGGDSLKAARLHALVEKGVRKNIPLIALFQEPTINGMARVVYREDWPVSGGILTPIRATGQLSPLFCIASPQVSTIGYAALACHLNEERPIFLLQAPDTEQIAVDLNAQEIQDIAREYVDALLAVQEQGPYSLLTMCSGSLIGIEMARQLEAQDKELAFFGVINTWALFTLSKFYYLQRVINRFKYYADRIAGVLSRGDVPISTQRTLTTLESEGASVDESLATMGAGSVDTIDSKSLIDIVGWGSQKPDTAYYNGKVTVFRVIKDVQKLWRVSDTDMGWGRHARHVEVVQLDVKEHEMVLREPWVEHMGQALEVQLAKTDCRRDISPG